ncbi:PREDICTED: hyaluronidase PH-20 [Chrysochloris asiatica]|uniref:Hyaluronidase n=1 Tax=Chrysochloris asiatica TaxID=185453 RepID=A0A9B0TFD9_CHRAS|nr:PREDICTED: hyaluronidase PH-20 [Chrysochloris asiatica]
MGVLRFKYISFGRVTGSNGASQALFICLLIPYCLTLTFRAPRLIPNVTFLWAWNAPTELCPKKFDVPLDLSLFSLIGSPRKGITKQGLTIFYLDRLGYYPYINEKTGKSVNGGIPQMASLTGHLAKAKEDISYYTQTNQTSLAVIDWEEWRPIWARNWKPKDIYRKTSVELVQQQNMQLNVTEATKRAKIDFQKAARSFMQETLKLGKLLRPKHLWGFYLFPECYNYHYTRPGYNGSCFNIEKRRNDELSWLWEESTALFPSIYLRASLTSAGFAALFVRNRVQEAIRVSEVRDTENPLPVFVYSRPIFSDVVLKYLSQDDLVNTLGESIALGVSGNIIWGSLNLTQNRQSCMRLANYMKSTLNLYIINITLAAKMCSQVFCQEQGICVRREWNSSDYLHLNPKNFAIQTVKGGQYIVRGKPTLEDLQHFSGKFQCSCYAGFRCKERDDIESIHAINVCIAKDVCIDTFLNEEPTDPLRGREKLSVALSNISSIPVAIESPCAPGADLSGCLKANFSEKANGQKDCSGVFWKNMSSLQNKTIEAANLNSRQSRGAFNALEDSGASKARGHVRTLGYYENLFVYCWTRSILSSPQILFDLRHCVLIRVPMNYGGPEAPLTINVKPALQRILKTRRKVNRFRFKMGMRQETEDSRDFHCSVSYRAE